MPIIRDIVYGAARYGTDLVEFCNKLEIDPSDLNNSEKKAPFETSCLAWEYALRSTGDPLLGLHLGEGSNPSIMGLVGYLMQNSEHLLDAFRQVSLHGRVATNMFEYRLNEKDDHVILTYEPTRVWKQTYPNGARQATDQAMAGTLNVFNLLSGKKVSPIKVHSTASGRKWMVEYERVFGGSVSLNSAADQLIFKRTDLLVAVLNHDRSLFKVFEKMVKERRVKATRTVRSQLQMLILEEFKGQVPPIQVLASRMNLTVRSLQRRLRAEKVGFRALAEDMKEEIATRLLASSHHKVSEVAGILGYSGPRSFRRAYKSWTKKTPEASRKVGKR
jgi:AraC-like DNA-binding protein